MTLDAKYQFRRAYHFTSIDNLPNILKTGFLCSNELLRRGITHVSVAEPSIQLRRSVMAVPCGPGGVVHDYVPFYFCRRTSMLQAVVHRKNVDQQFLVYIAVSLDCIDDGTAVFTNASANTVQPPCFYSSSNDLDKVPWDLIDNMGWRWNENQKQARMAELLIHRHVPVNMFAEIITWNPSFTQIVKDEFKKEGLDVPPIRHDTHFYFTKYPQDPNSSLVTGPYFLKRSFKEAIDTVISNRKSTPLVNPTFNDTIDAVIQLQNNFSLLPELKEIDQLVAANEYHSESVGHHTRTVVDRLHSLELYETLDERNKSIVTFAAYLHDIGKGTSLRDEHGRQKVDADHPANALPMMVRILSEEVKGLSREDIRQSLLLVIYHDLIGDVIGRERNREQILEIIDSMDDFDMLAMLAEADVSSLVRKLYGFLQSDQAAWLSSIKSELPNLRKWVEKQLQDRNR